MKKFIIDYLYFTRKERIAIFLLLAGIAIVFFWPAIYGLAATPKHLELDTAWIAKMKKLEVSKDVRDITKTDENTQQHYEYDKTISTNNARLFYFDPNKITGDQWQQLGVPEKTIGTIQNYLNKGGSFKKADDLQKIYGLRKTDYERLKPFIQIVFENENTVPANNSTAYKKESSNGNSFTGNKVVDINTADTSAFIRFPGIGSKLASRIVTFRDRLGGFYSVEQIKETYGLADSVFQKIKPQLRTGNAPVKKININAATIDELKFHPYLKGNLASLIVNYRNEHGPFQKAEDLKKIVAINNEVYEKIAPYVVTE